MYEPRYIPSISHTLLPTESIRFGISHFKGFRTKDDPQSDPLHIHNCVEVFFHLAGTVSFLIEGHLYPVAVGDAVLSQPNEIHMCLFEGDAECEHYCLWIDASNDPQLHSLLRAESPVRSFDASAQARILTLLARLEEICSLKNTELERTAYLLELLLLLQKNSFSKSESTHMPADLRMILADINENFTHIHSVGELLDTYFISPATLNRWFRKHLQISPHEYIESKKLAYASRLLREDNSVTDACLRAGFSDCSHFISLFKRKFGETPLQYKKSNR
jgi:AraC-like DNA-binding protein/mannose-6-phosphate isomerase-like protein (cupin superfamily)